METILLAWNPERFPWGTLQDELAKVRRSGGATDRWSVGNRTTLNAGARFFLIRLGVEPRGLVGSGWTTSDPFEDRHWDLDRAESGETARYADIFFDVLKEEPVVKMDELNRQPFSDVHWSTQMSGIAIAEHIAGQLETLWEVRTRSSGPTGLEEIQTATPKTQKHSSRVYVNKYERSSRARALCLAHHGMKCSGCEQLLADIYGPPAIEIVHVHHLTPLAEIPEEFEIDPIRDLRPVCPNCHSVIHSRQPSYTIDEVKAMISRVKEKR